MSKRAVFLTAAAVVAGVLTGGAPAQAVAGGDVEIEAGYGFVAKVQFGTSGRDGSASRRWR